MNEIKWTDLNKESQSKKLPQKLGLKINYQIITNAEWWKNYNQSYLQIVFKKQDII